MEPAQPKLMFPLVLDVTSLPVLAIGGAGVLARLAALVQAEALHVRVHGHARHLGRRLHLLDLEGGRGEARGAGAALEARARGRRGA